MFPASAQAHAQPPAQAQAQAPAHTQPKKRNKKKENAANGNIIHLDDPDDHNVPNNPDDAIGNAYSCYVCQTSFTCRRNLEYHLAHNVCIRQKEEEEHQLEISYRTCFLCMPKKVFNNRLSMRTHLRKIHQIGKMADYVAMVSKVEQWSIEVADDWGKFICRDNRWTNKMWLNDRWQYFLSPENPFTEEWFSKLPSLHHHDANNDTNNDANNDAIKETVLSEIYTIVDDILLSFFNELPNSNFNELHCNNSISVAASPHHHDESQMQSQSHNTISFLKESVWLEFFASLPTTINNHTSIGVEVFLYVMQAMIKLSRRFRSKYLIKKWFYPIYHWILWLRWNHIMNAKTHWKSLTIEEWVFIYQSVFNLTTYLPKQHYLEQNMKHYFEDLNNGGDNAMMKKEGFYYISFD